MGVLISNLREWPARRWSTALVTALATVIVIGVPTAMIITPWFGRDVPVTWWSWPVLLVTAVLTGLLVATYVRSPLVPVRRDRQGRFGAAGAVLGFFAVGCPVCNKLVLLALGTSGAMQFFAPIQPVIAAVSVVLVAWALVVRIQKENACTVDPNARPSAAISA